MTLPDPIDIADEQEYAWLLERSDTLTASLMEVWQSIPVRPGSWLGALVGYPLRLTLLAVTAVLAGGLMLLAMLAAAVTPVTVFALVESWVPGWIWITLLAAAGAAVVGYLLLAVIAHLHVASRGADAAAELPAILRDGIVARPVGPGSMWRPDEALHISHEQSRRGLFAALLLILGVLLQCLAVVQGDAWFAAGAARPWAWGLFFARSLFDTAFLGIPSALVPPWSAVSPGGTAGEVLMAGVNVTFAAGVLTLALGYLGSVLRTREVFHGTTRDLADYLHLGDIADGGSLTVHRVAVLRPLDRTQVVTFTKADLLERLSDAGSDGA